MEILLPPKPSHPHHLIQIKIDENEKLLPWKCSKVEVMKPVKKFEVFIDDKWFELKKIDD